MLPHTHAMLGQMAPVAAGVSPIVQFLVYAELALYFLIVLALFTMAVSPGSGFGMLVTIIVLLLGIRWVRGTVISSPPGMITPPVSPVTDAAGQSLLLIFHATPRLDVALIAVT